MVKKIISIALCATMMLSASMFSFSANAITASGEYPEYGTWWQTDDGHKFTYLDNKFQTCRYDGFEIAVEEGEEPVTVDVVEIPATLSKADVIRIERYAFRDSTFKEVVMPESIQVIEERAFFKSGIETLTIPDSVEYVDYYAFEYSKSLKDVTIGSGIIELKMFAFRGCEALQSVTYKDGATQIEQKTFIDCPSLTEVTLPSTLTTIANNAFLDCPQLTEIEIPTSVTSIGTKAFGYVGTEKVEGFTINTRDAQSVAVDYAKENGFNAQLIQDRNYGDIDGNGFVTSTDILAVLKNMALISGFDTVQTQAADVNASGSILISDALYMQRYVAQVMGTFPAGASFEYTTPIQ